MRASNVSAPRGTPRTSSCSARYWGRLRALRRCGPHGRCYAGATGQAPAALREVRTRCAVSWRLRVSSAVTSETRGRVAREWESLVVLPEGERLVASPKGGTFGRCGDAVRALHEGGVLLAGIRGYSTGGEVSCSTHNPWPAHPHPRAVADLRGARAEVYDDEAFQDPHRSGCQRRIALIVQVPGLIGIRPAGLATVERSIGQSCSPAACPARASEAIVLKRLRSHDTHTSRKTGVSLQLGAARGLAGDPGRCRAVDRVRSLRSSRDWESWRRSFRRPGPDRDSVADRAADTYSVHSAVTGHPASGRGRWAVRYRDRLFGTRAPGARRRHSRCQSPSRRRTPGSRVPPGTASNGRGWGDGHTVCDVINGKVALGDPPTGTDERQCLWEGGPPCRGFLGVHR